MIKVLVPISGGKDSQACLKLALQTYSANEILGLFCDTQFEHPKNYAHVKKIGELYGVQIKTVTGGSVLEKSEKYKRFPGSGSRHCTVAKALKEKKDIRENLMMIFIFHMRSCPTSTRNILEKWVSSFDFLFWIGLQKKFLTFWLEKKTYFTAKALTELDVFRVLHQETSGKKKLLTMMSLGKLNT
jgi:hypothetical protein